MNDKRNDSPGSPSPIVLYQTEDGRSRIEVRLENETVWLTQQLMAELFQTAIPNISMHIRNVYADGELTPEATVKEFLTVRREGNRDVQRGLEFYNRIVVMFLDQAEFRAQRRQDIKMRDWTGFLDNFLRDTELPVLEGAGSVSQEDARSWAESQHDAFAERRRLLAEQTAEKQYVEDLESAAKKLATVRKKRTAKRKGGKKHT